MSAATAKADPFGDFVKFSRQHAQDCAAIVRDHNLRLVNTAIILSENAGLEMVPLDLLRDLAAAIAQSPMPSDRKPADG